MKLEFKVKKICTYLSNLKNLSEGNLKNKKIKTNLYVKCNLENKGIAEPLEQLKQRVMVVAREDQVM
ncbi:hypothetical protein NXF25_009608 [Crotalus adamanteus]|uniref:Uncharacterized protein n=1 Tax=Crotalus adamanteus TaxID=8729 RepID=A0AAW1BSP5_CROAD